MEHGGGGISNARQRRKEGVKPWFFLLTQKGADFILFKEVVKLMNNKAHLSIQGLNQIINIKASMNLGLSDFYFF